MRRLLQLVLLYMVLAQATGLAWASTGDACTGGCDDDGGSRQACPPDCPDCVCSIHVPPTVAPAVAPLRLPAATARRVTFAEPLGALPSPPPREIAHVPRSPIV